MHHQEPPFRLLCPRSVLLQLPLRFVTSLFAVIPFNHRGLQVSKEANPGLCVLKERSRRIANHQVSDFVLHLRRITESDITYAVFRSCEEGSEGAEHGEVESVRGEVEVDSFPSRDRNATVWFLSATLRDSLLAKRMPGLGLVALAYGTLCP